MSELKKLQYPDKYFMAAWKESLSQGSDFYIVARLGKFRKQAIVGFLDELYYGEKRNFGFTAALGSISTSGLHGCIASVFSSGNYAVTYKNSDKGLVIEFVNKKK